MSHTTLLCALVFAIFLCHLDGVMLQLSPDCSSPSDCYPGECCAIGMIRYSMPRCIKLGDIGDFCYMNAQPLNLSVSYPNGAMKHMTDVYTLFCPCNTDRKLHCQRGRCLPPNSQFEEDEVDYNYVL